jgi:uncharacterized protein (TIGR00730 family)
MRTIRRVCVFCGSSDGNRPGVHRLAEHLGGLLAARGIGLVYGGAKIGVMGRLADAVLDGGGAVTGVLPGGLFSREVPHEGLTELHVVDGMHERKALMYSLADGFVALPGGLGTLDELFEAATWNQLRLHEPRKPITLLDDDGFWAPMLQMVDTMVAAGFVKAEARRQLQHATTPTLALDQLAAFEFPH